MAQNRPTAASLTSDASVISPHEARQTLATLASLIAPEARVPDGFQKQWFFNDDTLALEYRSDEGFRYAFDFRLTPKGLHLAAVGRDDSSRHSLRVRCSDYGHMTDRASRLELARWPETTPTIEAAMDALGRLQQVNTAMSKPAPWVPPRSIPSYWWDLRRNFGDLIGPWIIEMVSGRPTHNTMGYPQSGDALVGVGSLISSLQRPGTTIWGSGLIAPITPRTRGFLKKRTPARVLAVRGHHTRQELRTKLGWDVPDVYGDPALLIGQLFDPTTGSAPTAQYAVCPHYVHLSAITNRARISTSARVIDVRRDAESVVTDIARSQVVISTSLHGLIVAQSYGIPWVWLRVEDSRLAGDRFKFEDFFTTLDRDAVASTTVSIDDLDQVDFAAVARTATVPGSKFDAARLLEAFPYPTVNAEAWRHHLSGP